MFCEPNSRMACGASIDRCPPSAARSACAPGTLRRCATPIQSRMPSPVAGDSHVFYVGKGVGGRINAHVREAGKNPESERARLRTIAEIEAVGRGVELLFLRTGIEDAKTAFVVEQAVIDAFAADGHPLTNLVCGHHSGSEGLATLATVVARHRRHAVPAHRSTTHHGEDPEGLEARLQ